MFCANADSLGNCKGQGETFEWKGDKTALYLMVMNKDGIRMHKMKFMLFTMKNDREGELYADLTQYILPNSLYTAKKMYFYKPGYYRVDVLDENNNPIGKSYITITDRRE